MPIYYHVTPRRNVDSIRQHGLDYTKGEAMWHHDGATPGNYFWDHPGHADQYANELDERDQQEYGSMNWDEENDGHVVLPFNHDALALPDPENEWNDEMEGRSFYSPDPIPASAFHHTASRLAAFPDGLHIQPEDDDWVAYHQGTPVGSLSVDYSTEVPSIDSIRVHPDYRRHGIGKALWEAAGRPAHTPDDMSADGQAWARAVGGPRLAMPAPLQFPIEHLEPHNLYDPVAATDSDHYPDLVRHIREHGVQMPITLETDGELGLVADGNHRLAAAREAGLTHLPVRFLRESTRNLERWGGTPLHPAIQQHLADNPASIASTYDRQPSWAQGDYITSSRLAMPAYYHHTDDPDFHPDPERQPTSMSQHPGGPGIFLTPEERPDMWKGLHGGDDYRVEFHADDDITGHPGVWSENYGLDGAPLEIFVPGDQMHHLTVKNVHPRKAKYMTAAVTVYTKPNCPQCTMTKKQLDRLGIEHRDIDVTVDPDAHAYVTGLGYTAAPVVVIGDGENHWAGFKPDRLKGLVE
jgi:glutaredoxin-like protein NrdH